MSLCIISDWLLHKVNDRSEKALADFQMPKFIAG
ncbi:hypothetical protein FP742_00230 [Vibrio parahaemolyticus]|uniref:Uncharacterized protein n=1 Tax=Vibrio parahaemolyticus serotype O3:K6 (strain RIMD 2210633) TaxID=223926 RepID=Q87SP1_VIBPA|nr:hypothetical protein A6J30_25095 [Vibrio parahaemolyticus]BAC58644.1 hypothetical protein [Vibrio parahaemolyticus RIMD 2210633]HAS6243494.1 hypothetical protein [Vibrio vulnificus]AZV72088.1 hypothetical protein D0853_14470 [Vibrio parahaemolyticus]EGQ8459373.1 hypothetical protein [Vibrio parahaemolyticus]